MTSITTASPEAEFHPALHHPDRLTTPAETAGSDTPSVTVPLTGKHAQGRTMTLDAADWQHAREAWGATWTLVSNGQGRDYGASSRHALRALADQPGSGDTARLSRLLLGAGRGEVVIFVDGNPLNLRRKNLVRLNRAGAAQWRSAQVAKAAAVH